MTLSEDSLRELLERDHAPPLTSDEGLSTADEGLVPAAVLVAITERPRPGLILTRRTAHLRKHAGQVAFPGGRIDADDDGPVSAALREAEEEIGLTPSLVRVIGTSDVYRTFTGFIVTPVLAIVPPELELTPHAEEVAAIFEAPLDHVLDPANHSEKEVEFQGRRRRYYEILWEEHRIWGATAAMIINLAARLKASA